MSLLRDSAFCLLEYKISASETTCIITVFLVKLAQNSEFITSVGVVSYQKEFFMLSVM